MNIKSALIGYTGFIGSNLIEQFQFEKVYNSKNIAEIEEQEIDLLVCAGVSAVKWVANQKPETDIANIEKLKQSIQKTKIKHFVLISTIDIYDSPFAVTEDNLPDIIKQDYYGKHRYRLEQWLTSTRVSDSYNIIRLPGLFGNNLKKNLIFDILNPLAKSINQALWQDLQTKLDPKFIVFIKTYYHEDDFGNLQLQPNTDPQIKDKLVAAFASVKFSTLNFTDSRSSFQFYSLANLWNDINKAIRNHYPILNISSPPISAQELVKFLTGSDFTNHTNKGPILYDIRSKYATNGKYLYAKQDVLEQIKIFVEANK